jgi:hypothetical protein
MGKMSRTKGAMNERALANYLKTCTGLDVRRRCRQHPGDSDVMGLEDWSIECKVQKVLRLDAWWEQACNQTDDAWPVLFWRKHGCSQWWCRSRLADMVESMELRPERWINDPNLTVDMKAHDWLVAVGLWNPQS